MRSTPLSRFVCFALALSLFLSQAGIALSVQQAKNGRIQPAKSPNKKAKRGTIEVKNDTGKECNDLHFFFKKTVPTIENIKKKGGGNPFKGGYRSHGSVGGQDAYADFGRQDGDGSVKDGETIILEIAWDDEMPEYTAVVWTLNGLPQSAAADAPAQEIKILGKDADAARAAKEKEEAKAKAEREKAQKEAEAEAKKEEEKAQKEAEKKAKQDAEKAKKEAAKREKAEKGIQKSVVPDGLQRAILETPNGRLTVLLPDDMAAGDTITGTVVAEPYGKSDAERQKNSDELSGYVVDIDGEKKGALGDGKLRFLAPLAAGAVTLSLLNQKGGKPVTIDLPVQPSPAPTPGNLPLAGQGGKTVSIPGSFDPSQPAQVWIGGKEVPVLAESPRQAVALVPRDLVGPQTLEVREGGRLLGSGQMAVVRMSLTAPKTNLLRGESADVKVRIEGLQPISFAGDRLEVYFDPAYAIIQNHTPEVVEFFGPGSEPFVPTLPLPLPPTCFAVKIDRAKVSADGVFETTVRVRSKTPGAFSISALFVPGKG